MKKKSNPSYSNIEKTQSLKFSRATLYDELIDEARLKVESRQRRAGEFTRLEFIAKSGMSEAEADRFLKSKHRAGVLAKRAASAMRVFYRFVEVKK